MGTVSVTNIIPQSLSGESNQDSEPNLAVNPQDANQMVATAFTPSPMGGTLAPIFVSTDGGATWSLRNVVPGAGNPGFPTKDITVSFATSGGTLYAAILQGGDPGRRMQILRSPGFSGTAAMAVLMDRTGPDQPWVVAGTSGNADRLWVGNNALGTAASATIDASADARVASPGFARSIPEARATSGQDGPPVRLAAHSDGTVYAGHVRWARAVGNNISFDIVVTRDDHWGTGANGFRDLLDARDNVVGTRVADDLYAFWNAEMGQERLGADLAIAVDPTDSSTVWVAWGYKFGGPTSTIPWTIDVARSTDRGRNWAPVRRTIVNGKNPGLAVNSRGALGFLYQEFTGTEWVTRLEVTSDAWATAAETHDLHRAPSGTPARSFFPYLGDYAKLLSVGRNFYGIFSGSNAPNPANFPSGISYQRNADWAGGRLLNTDGVSTVQTSIDPFVFTWRASLTSPIISRRPPPIVPRTITPRGGIVPIEPRGINPRQPPIIPRVGPIGPIGPIGPVQAPEPPTDLDL
jgi:hypothetical protein